MIKNSRSFDSKSVVGLSLSPSLSLLSSLQLRLCAHVTRPIALNGRIREQRSHINNIVYRNNVIQFSYIKM